jgi:hypothetical protein
LYTHYITSFKGFITFPGITVENSSTGSDWKRVLAQSGNDYISYRRRAAREKYPGRFVKKKIAVSLRILEIL